MSDKILQSEKNSLVELTNNDLLIPNLKQHVSEIVEPNYDEMDNLTLLTSLCIDDNNTKCTNDDDLLLPDFN